MTDVARYAHNAKVLAYLARGETREPVFAWHRDYSGNRDPYWEAGCHPDIVERLWKQIGTALPSDCCSLVCGTPALTHPVSGAILAIGMGTEYGLRLAEPSLSAALAAGAKTLMTWGAGGGSTDLRKVCGADWLFGGWATKEPEWCRHAFDAFGKFGD